MGDHKIRRFCAVLKSLLWGIGTKHSSIAGHSMRKRQHAEHGIPYGLVDACVWFLKGITYSSTKNTSSSVCCLTLSKFIRPRRYLIAERSSHRQPFNIWFKNALLFSPLSDDLKKSADLPTVRLGCNRQLRVFHFQ